MELLIFVLVVCAVAGLALRFGYDSRETAYSSKEEVLSRLGVSGISEVSDESVGSAAKHEYAGMVRPNMTPAPTSTPPS
jgi:hypothetical protein